MTGVLVLVGGSLLLQEANDTKQQKRITNLLCDLCVALRPSVLRRFFKAEMADKRRERRGNISELFVSIVLDRCTFIWFLWKRLTGNAILAFDPLAEVDELAPLRTEGTKRIVFPIDWFTAGWAFHESLATNTTSSHQRDAGRLINIRRLTNAIVPSRRMAFKRTVTLSRVEPTIEAISR